MKKFSFIDLFSGIGGFRLALESVGGKCLGFSEIASDAIETYCKNFNENEDKNFGDITKLTTLPTHDFMTAGVPCQSWSIAGKNLGFEDDRGQLWNDTIYLLNKVRPRAFIFENVKGLADPRNEKALNYIMARIKESGYYAKKFIINSYDYGVPQTRVRIYIVGFREELYLNRFTLPAKTSGIVQLRDVLDIKKKKEMVSQSKNIKPRWSLSCNENGFNDYFLFNDLRNGDTTLHSWDIESTTEKEKKICMLLLKNRRKSIYGPLDGNPLSLKNLQDLDDSITQSEINSLIDKNILKKVSYIYQFSENKTELSTSEKTLLSFLENGFLNIDKVKHHKTIKKEKIDFFETIKNLESKNVLKCIEVRYDFKNTKISTGLKGINRIFLPSSKIYPTLVASDTNDFISTVDINEKNIDEFKKTFIKEVYLKKNYRKITKEETCKIQGFPENYILPEARVRWMKLLGNSVSVPVVKILAQAVVNTGVFDGEYVQIKNELRCDSFVQLELFSDEDFNNECYA